MNEDMFVLTVDVMRTTGRFDPKYIKKNNNRTTWGCPVTLNAEDHYDKLQKLGRIEAYVPKADVFPPESGPDEDDERFERFEASLWKVGQMLHTKVTHKGRCLNVTFFPAPVWMPYSEFQYERDKRDVQRPVMKPPAIMPTPVEHPSTITPALLQTPSQPPRGVLPSPSNPRFPSHSIRRHHLPYPRRIGEKMSMLPLRQLPRGVRPPPAFRSALPFNSFSRGPF